MEGPSDGFPPLVAQEKVDVLALMAPAAKVTPTHILDLLRNARTNLLIWRQNGGNGWEGSGA